MTPAAVAASKQFLRDYVGTWGDTLGRRLGYAVDDAFYGIAGAGLPASLRGAIDRVTPEQVNAAIRTHLRTDGMYLVIVTADAARLKEKLVRGAASSITYTSPPGPALAADDTIIGAVPLGVREADVTILPIDRVFQ